MKLTVGAVEQELDVSALGGVDEDGAAGFDEGNDVCGDVADALGRAGGLGGDDLVDDFLGFGCEGLGTGDGDGDGGLFVFVVAGVGGVAVRVSVREGFLGWDVDLDVSLVADVLERSA